MVANLHSYSSVTLRSTVAWVVKLGVSGLDKRSTPGGTGPWYVLCGDRRIRGSFAIRLRRPGERVWSPRTGRNYTKSVLAVDKLMSRQLA